MYRERGGKSRTCNTYIYIYVYEGRGDRGTSYADGWSEKRGADREEEEPGRGGARGEGNIYIYIYSQTILSKELSSEVIN